MARKLTRASLKKFILEVIESENWYQMSFVDSSFLIRTTGKFVHAEERIKKVGSYCGTACCVAGHIVNEFGLREKVVKLDEKYGADIKEIPLSAMAIIIETLFPKHEVTTMRETAEGEIIVTIVANMFNGGNTKEDIKAYVKQLWAIKWESSIGNETKIN